MKKKKKRKEITQRDDKAYYIAKLIKNRVTSAEDRHIDRWHRTENPKIDPHKRAHLNFDNDTKALPGRKNRPFNEQCWSNWTPMGQRKP